MINIFIIYLFSLSKMTSYVDIVFEEDIVDIGGEWYMSKRNDDNVKWNNPFTFKDNNKLLSIYEEYIRKNLWNDLHELHGKTLKCNCNLKKCHGTILEKLLNEYQEWKKNLNPVELYNIKARKEWIKYKEQIEGEKEIDKRQLTIDVNDEFNVYP